jgi:hypothetical protein
MEKSNTSQTLRQLADKMRQQAKETALPDYQGMMNRVAESLDAEADLVAEQQSREFSRALNSYYAAQSTRACYH